VGNRRGLDELEVAFVENHSLLRNVIGRRVHCSDVVDDLTSEVWIAAAIAYRNGQIETVTPGWLVTVAKRRVIDHWRRTGFERSREQRITSNRERYEEVSALECFLAADESMLGLVTDETAALLRLRYLDGHSVGDIADDLGVTYQAAESRLARARRSLRGQLEIEPAAA